jgi:transcription elongation GreA/GreB family factor
MFRSHSTAGKPERTIPAGNVERKGSSVDANVTTQKSKTEWIQAVLARIDELIDRQEQSVEAQKEHVDTTPASSMSSGETDRTEGQWVLDSLRSNLKALEDTRARLERFVPPVAQGRAALGSLVTFAPVPSGAKRRVLILPLQGVGAVTVTLPDGTEVTAVSPDAPLASVLLNRKPGDTVETRIRTMPRIRVESVD